MGEKSREEENVNLSLQGFFFFFLCQSLSQERENKMFDHYWDSAVQSIAQGCAGD